MVLEKTLESPLDCKEVNQSILKEISPGISLEGMMLRHSAVGPNVRLSHTAVRTAQAFKY